MGTVLAAVNEGLRKRGVRGVVVAHQERLYWRGTAADVTGVRRRRRVPLDLPAGSGHLVEAENRVIALAAEIQRTGVIPEPLPWDAPPPLAGPVVGMELLTVEEAVRRLETSFWLGKVRTAAAERTWARVRDELRRLPPRATLTIDLLVAVAGGTEAGSRTRLEACKVFKRLGRLVGLGDLERLDAIRTPYEPGEREPPNDGELVAVLEGLDRAYRWAWLTWALATYGCRPAEVFSLRPADDGTARVLTVKRKGKAPTYRTAMALPVSEGLSQWGARSTPWEVNAPSAYDSAEAKRQVDAWSKWLVRQAPGLRLYDLRHAWALRSIRRGVPTGLAAKCMGHSIAVHSATYHRALEQADVAAFVARSR